ncbi:MAG: hypothetical protein O3B47_05040, partial [bacterium]|nr:hypothetical protein [bacterium]
MTTPGNPESGPTQVPDQVPAAAQTRGPRERSSSADEPAIELVDDEKNRETRRVKDVIKDAKATVVKMFRGKRIKLKTNRGEIAMDTMEYILTFPFLHMEEQWIEDIEAIPAGDRKAEALSELRVEYGHYKPNKTGLGRVHETVMMTEAYLEKMSHEEGWITPEVLAEMINSLSAKASIFADLLAKKGNTDVLEALKWSLNIADDMVEGETQAIETLQKRLPKEFTEKGECMDALWMTLSFSNKDKRIEIAKHFAKEDPGQLSAFLKEGNRRGVYSPDEMKGLGMTFSEDENAQYASNFKEARNFTANAQQMLSRSYGTVNAAAEMMTGENLLTFIGYVAAGTTVIANLGVGAFTMYRDQDFSPDRIVKTVVSKNVIGGALAWKGLDLLRSGGKAGQILAGKEKRD